MSNLWDVCDYCGSIDLAFYDIGTDTISGQPMTEIHCEQCGDVWDDYTENYPEVWSTDDNTAR